MKRRGRHFALWLILPFVAVLLAYSTATVLSQMSARHIDEMALSIANNAAPSIQFLSDARAELRRELLALADYVDAKPDERPEILNEYYAARRSMEAGVRAYMVLPTYPDEKKLWGQIDEDIARVEQLSLAVLAKVQVGNPKAADKILDDELRDVVEQTLADLQTTLEFNAREARQLAVNIEGARGRLELIAYGLDGVSGLIAIIAGLLVVRAARRYTRLADEHTQLVEARANELEQFAGRVSHDVLGPLSAINIALSSLEPRVTGDEQTARLVSRGRSSIARVLKIVNGLYDFARAGARPSGDGRADLREVVEDVLGEHRGATATHRIELVSDLQVAGQVACSPGVLTSVVGNLVANAVKYMGQSDVRRVVVRARETGTLIRLEVEDTGPGIPPGFEERIFEPYVRAPMALKDGVGLGLATVKRIVEAHGGRVGVSSNAGQGSVFWVELPCVPLLATAEPQQVVPPTVH
jgi:signal transduction histidine kinase